MNLTPFLRGQLGWNIMNLTPFLGEFGRVLVEKLTMANRQGRVSRTGPYGTFGMEPASLKLGLLDWRKPCKTKISLKASRET